MKLHDPIVITSRLLPGVRIGDAEVSIQYDRVSRDGRTVYGYFIDQPGHTYIASDLRSGVGGGSLQYGLSQLLGFLSAAAEAYGYELRGGESDDGDMFPKAVTEWAYRYADEISMLQLEIEETKGLIKED